MYEFKQSRNNSTKKEAKIREKPRFNVFKHDRYNKNIDKLEKQLKYRKIIGQFYKILTSEDLTRDLDWFEWR